MDDIYLAIDIGGTFLKYGLINRNGELIEDNQMVTSPNWDGLMASVSEVINDVGENLLGIGISCPGTVDVEKGIVYDGGLLPYLDKVNLKSYIEDSYEVPCWVTNDGKAAIMAEIWQGNLKDVLNGAAIVLGSGVAGAIVLNGSLLEGSNYKAGEFSFISNLKGEKFAEHNMVGFDASAVKFIRTCAEVLNFKDLHDGPSVFEVIATGENKHINGLFDEYCMVISHLIMNLQAILDLEKIVIGGGISKQSQLIHNVIFQYQKLRNEIPIYKEKFPEIEIDVCKYYNSSNLLGAVYPFFKY